MDKYNMVLPRITYSGVDALENLRRVVAGCKKAAIFTDKGILGAGLVDLPQEIVRSAGVETVILSDIPAEPSYGAVQTLVDEFRTLGADIIMQLDELSPWPCDAAEAARAMRRTLRWLERCMDAKTRDDQALFGIVQGAFYEETRRECAREMAKLDLPGYGIGGLSVGEGKAEMYDLLYHTAPLLPSHKPRYLMGVGTPLDIAHGIHAGVDMFDCVLPTRNARNGTLYTSLGKVNIKRKEYAEDDGPLDPACGCYTCRTFSRAYLRHLYVSKELLSFRLNSLHNLTYFLSLAREARQAVLENRFAAFLAGIESLYPEEAARAAGV